MQKTFQKQINNNTMCDVIVAMGNPFMDSFNELITLDNHDCMRAIIPFHGTFGEEQYSKYVTDVRVERKTVVHKVINNKTIALFRAFSLHD